MSRIKSIVGVGCTSNINSIPIIKQDIVIVGAGMAGLVAAIEAVATEKNVKVTVIEKMKDVYEAPRPFFWGVNTYGGLGHGNNTSRSGGGVGPYFPCPYSKETSLDFIVERAKELACGRPIYENVFRYVTKRLNDDMDWLMQNGFPVAPTLSRERATRLSYTPGAILGPKGWGRGLLAWLLPLAEKSATIQYQHKAIELLTDIKRRVVGVRTLSPDGFKDFRAKAVILATGGFEGNQEMLLKYLGHGVAYNSRLTGSPYNTGDGHRMVMRLDAKMVNMDTCHTRWVDGSTGYNPHRSFGYWGIYINKLGKRFVDESGGSTETSYAVISQPEHECILIIDEEIRKLRSDSIEKYTNTGGSLLKFNTLTELAETAKLPFESFKGTIDNFNAAVKPDHTAQAANPSKGKDRPTAYKIESAPFYAVTGLRAGLNQTNGGPLIDENGQVLDTEDKPIPGLYAAGEFAFGWLGQSYHVTEPHSGIELSTTLGRMAGANAAKYAVAAATRLTEE